MSGPGALTGASLQKKPLFFVVHGAWVTTWAFSPLLPLLWKLGYPTWCLDLPHSQGNPSSSMTDDIRFLRQELRLMCDSGHDVIPVLYSYGGLVGGAALEGFYKTERQAKGEEGGIIGVVFATCPLLAKKGISPTENLGYWDLPSWLGGQGSGGLSHGPFMVLTETAKASFFDGLPNTPDLGFIYTHLFRPLSTLSHNTPVESTPILYTETDPYTPYSVGEFQVPTSYMVATMDRTIPTKQQERAVEMYEGKWTSVYRLPGGHMWMIACPELAAFSLIDFAEKVRAKG